MLDSLIAKRPLKKTVISDITSTLSLENEINIYFNYFDDVLPEKERLVNRVKAFIATQTITSDNKYRYVFDARKGSLSNVNPFVYDAIPFRKEKLKSIRKSDDENWKMISAYVKNEDFCSSDYFSAYLKSKRYMAIHRPDLISISWNKLPDPPSITDNAYLPAINKIPLNFEYLKYDPFKTYVPEGIELKKHYWKTFGLIDLQLSQNHSSLWDGKDASLFAFQGRLNYHADYAKENVSWENGFELRLGMIQAEKSDLYKNEDNLKLNTKFGYKAVNNWSYAVNLECITQVMDGDKDGKLSSALLTPARIPFSVGMDLKKSKKDMRYSLFLSPVTATFNYGFDSLRTIFSADYLTVDMGGSVRWSSTLKLKEDITWSSKFYVFQEFDNFDRIPQLDMESILFIQINHLISAHFDLYLKYDKAKDKTGAKTLMWQFKEFVSIGFTHAI